MKINQNIKIVGEKVILVPYEAKHVEKYHEWMKNEDLQLLTASEPLSLEEEYAMQRSWRDDNDKCTFLILSKAAYLETHDEIASLIGDTNLFLMTEEDEEKKIGEAEIMIAEKDYRGQGCGWEAMLLMLKYGAAELKLDTFIVKIGADNLNSIKMFTKIQFEEISRSSVFNEITLQRPITTEWTNWLDSQVKLKIENYER